MSSTSLYAAFDVYPAPKGAATHIRHMAKTLFDYSGAGCLYTLGGEGLPCYQREDNVEIVRFSKPVSNLLERAIQFGEQLSHVIDARAESLEICHFRDPWGGLPVLSYRDAHKASYKTVYEVNALPSIELPYAFPHIAMETLDKIAQHEKLCLDHSDVIITPSHTTAAHLHTLGVPPNKVRVIPNGADILPDSQKPSNAPDNYIIYFGAIQQWQGIDTLLRAFQQLGDFTDLKLVLCVAKHNRIAKQYRKMAERLGIAERIVWYFGLTQNELFPLIQHAKLSLAPLADCPRNRIQGCCPLKIVESMALGTLVVASDLPVVRELLEDKQHGLLVRPDRPYDLALAVRCLLEEPRQALKMGLQGRQRIEEAFTWRATCAKLKSVYKTL